MTAPYATSDDVLARLGKAGETDSALLSLITVRLGDAERMIRRKLVLLGRDLDTDIIDNVLDVEDVKQVECEAVLRLARNPEGYMSESDGSYTYQMLQSISTGTLTIEPNEWAILGVASQLGAMFVIVPTAKVAS